MTIAERCAKLPVMTRRLLALVAVPLLLVLTCSAVFVPLGEAWQSQQRWRQETRQLLADAAAAPALQSTLDQQIQAARRSRLQSKLYPAGGAMSATAVLQGDVDLLMESLQASSRTIAPIASTEVPPLLRHGVRLSTSLRINQLQDLLNRVAQHPRLLRIEQLTVVAPQMQLPDDNPALAVTMDIHGYSLMTSTSTSPRAVMAAGGTRP